MGATQTKTIASDHLQSHYDPLGKKSTSLLTKLQKKSVLCVRPVSEPELVSSHFTITNRTFNLTLRSKMEEGKEK